MGKTRFAESIGRFVPGVFEAIVEEAEERFADPVYDYLTPQARNLKIREFARLILISKLVDEKGSWLSVLEMQIALDLFHHHCAVHPRLNAVESERGGVGILQGARDFLGVDGETSNGQSRGSGSRDLARQWTAKPGQ